MLEHRPDRVIRTRLHESKAEIESVTNSVIVGQTSETKRKKKKSYTARDAGSCEPR